MPPRPVATKRITSVDNPQVRAIARLLDSSRERRAQARYVLEGAHLVDAFDRAGTRFDSLVISDSGLRDPELASLFDRARAGQRIVLGDRVFAKLSDLASPPGILALTPFPDHAAQSRSDADILFLDRIQDAGNVGAIMRTAAAAGVGTLACGTGTADAWSPRVLRAAMGAHCALRIAELDFAELRRMHGSHQVVATAADAPLSIFDCDLIKPVLWLFGNEGAGLDPALAAQADLTIRIPIAAAVESLNVAASAAVCLFEQQRQRIVAARKDMQTSSASVRTRVARSARPE